MTEQNLVKLNVYSSVVAVLLFTVALLWCAFTG
jgi:hypothetical protein